MMIFFLAFLALALISGPLVRSAGTTTCPGRMSVRGEATVEVKPDEGYASLTIHTEGSLAATARNLLVKKMKETMDAVLAVPGISADNIHTTNMSLQPVWKTKKK